MKVRSDYSQVVAGVIGSLDFQRRAAACLQSASSELQVFSASTADAWAKIVSDRPNFIVVDIGLKHSDRTHGWLRDFLAQIRDRFGNEIYIVVALTAPEKLAFGGDLLYSSQFESKPSDFVDTFVAQPPSGIPSSPPLDLQLSQVLDLFCHEQARRRRSLTPLPPLNSPSWVQSLADPRSRELWMVWLPRYASYTNENPIITGLTGTGKTKLASALHLLSGRKGPFISITPRDFSSSELVQAELFGAVAGAYTGAVDKWGLVKSAEGGTLFIDELQSIDKDLQGKLITFIENKTYRRVGSAETTKADVRFCFATNQPIDEMVRKDRLRDDFAYRLERVALELLPLSERRLDITAALGFALAKIRRERPQTGHISGFTSAAYRMLFAQSWPGNLRQLENTVAQLCELADIEGEHLINEQVVSNAFETLAGTAHSVSEVVAQAASALARLSLREGVSSLDQGVEKFVDQVRMSALEAASGNPNMAARLIDDSERAIEQLARTKALEQLLRRVN